MHKKVLSVTCRIFVLFLLLAAFLYIAESIPYTHDDWDWGLDIGFDRFFHASLNNRYVGTFFVLVMTRSPLLKTLLMGLSMFAIPVFSARLVTFGENKPRRFALICAASAAFTAMPAITWRQTYGWVSAFANFVISAVFLLTFLLIIRTAFSVKQYSWMFSALSLLTAFLLQFFSENLTVVFALFCLVLMLYALIHKRARLVSLFALIGAAAGAYCMFCNSLYGDLAQSGEALNGIRSLAVGTEDTIPELISSVCERFFTVLLPKLFETHPAVLVLLGVACIIRAFSQKKPFFSLAGGWLLLFSLFTALIADNSRAEYYYSFPYPEFRTLLSVLTVLILFAALLTDGRGQRLTRIALLLFSLGLIAPFSIIAENGPRCFLLSHLLLLILALSLLSDLPLRGWLTGTALAAAVLVLAFRVEAYTVIRGCSALRAELITQAVESEAAAVSFPTESDRYVYSWGRNPQSIDRVDYFREFYELPDDMQLIFLPNDSYSLWPDIPNEMWQKAKIYK